MISAKARMPMVTSPKKKKKNPPTEALNNRVSLDLKLLLVLVLELFLHTSGVCTVDDV